MKKDKEDIKVSKEIVIYSNPKSVSSETIRTLRTNVQFSMATKKDKVLLLTSSVPGEGKTFITSNLAASFALVNKKVLIIDCDLRKGREHKLFCVNNEKGLSDLLIDDINKYKDYISKTEIKDLYLLPMGTVPPNPSELLSSDNALNLISKLRKDYDLIILDCPPVSAVADSLVLSKLADEAIIVCSHKLTHLNELAETKKSLDAAGIKIAGVVLNRIDKSSRRYYKYYN